jgi:hypothetical protein
VIGLIDAAIRDLTEARDAWKRGYSSRCIRCLFDVVGKCKEGVYRAAEGMES